MEHCAHSKKIKYLLTIIIVITIPIWLSIINYSFSFIIHAGRIIGTYMRVIDNNICLKH